MLVCDCITGIKTFKASHQHDVVESSEHQRSNDETQQDTLQHREDADDSVVQEEKISHERVQSPDSHTTNPAFNQNHY